MNMRVLVVDDKALLAIDIADQLTDAGFHVVGTAPSVNKAIGLIEEVGCDVALLDFNLRNETAEPIASRLDELGIPFIILSGISRDRLPASLIAAVLLTKPVSPSILVEALHKSVRPVHS
jgi:DNA-binding response OmpR family regulator